ncbi:MAG: HAD-IB family hydrolase [Ilumatobacteraceae bacterium]
MNADQNVPAEEVSGLLGGGAANARVLAAFDVDGTLTKSDCVAPFLRRLGGRRAMLKAAMRRPGATLVAGIRRDRDALKQIFVGGVLRGRTVSDVDACGAEFATEVHQRRLRADVLARLHWHQRSGHHIVLVSASLGPYLRPLGALLGVDGVLCADVSEVDGRFGETLVSGNCRGAEKARRLGDWRRANALDDAELWAYGDSSGDRELLDLATHPVWVRHTTISAVPATGIIG